MTQWNVKHLTLDYQDARHRLDAALTRQFRAYNLPSGVTFDNIERWWTSLDFGGVNKGKAGDLASVDADTTATASSESVAAGDGGEELPPPTTETEEFLRNFQAADNRIKHLRNIAKRGRETSEALEKEEQGKPKTVLSQAETWVK